MMRTVAALLLTLPIFAASDVTMTPAERTYLVDQLEQSKKDMLASIDGLTLAQWKFKPAPDVWSVQDCAEHIVLAEGFIFGGAQKILTSPAVPRPETSTAAKDQAIVAGVKDRSHKGKAPEPLVPSEKFATPADAAQAFTEARDKTIAYAKSTNDDVRAHVGDTPGGKMDVYQFMLLISAHSARHTAQIREVEANAGYPKAAALTQPYVAGLIR